MRPHHSVIREAYRAALADWAVKEIDGRENESEIIRHTASLASVWTNEAISEKNVIDVLKACN